MGDDNRLTCEECRALAEENQDVPECQNGPCPYRNPPQGVSRLTARAMEAWHTLNAYGRPLDTFGGCPLPLRLEAINEECSRTCDPDGIRWRVLLIEEIIYAARLKQHQAKSEKTKR